MQHYTSSSQPWYFSTSSGVILVSAILMKNKHEVYLTDYSGCSYYVEFIQFFNSSSVNNNVISIVLERYGATIERSSFTVVQQNYVVKQTEGTLPVVVPNWPFSKTSPSSRLFLKFLLLFTWNLHYFRLKRKLWLFVIQNKGIRDVILWVWTRRVWRNCERALFGRHNYRKLLRESKFT